MLEAVNLYFMCKHFGQLPRPGGMLDQPARLMYVFESIVSAESERAALDQARSKRAGNRA